MRPRRQARPSRLPAGARRFGSPSKTAAQVESSRLGLACARRELADPSRRCRRSDHGAAGGERAADQAVVQRRRQHPRQSLYGGRFRTLHRPRDGAHRDAPRRRTASSCSGRAPATLRAGIVVQRVLGLRNVTELAPASPRRMRRRGTGSAGSMQAALPGRRSISRVLRRIRRSCRQAWSSSCSGPQGARFGGNNGVNVEAARGRSAAARPRWRWPRRPETDLDTPTTQVKMSHGGTIRCRRSR